MRFCPLLFVLLLAGVAPAAQIALRESVASPSGPLVLLGDVAEVTGRGSERLSRVPLMPTPAAGEQERVSSRFIRQMLAAQGEKPESHYFTGAYAVRVGAASRPTTPAETAPVAAPIAAPEQAAPSPTPRNPAAFRIRRGGPSSTGLITRRSSSALRKATEEAAVAAVQAALDKHVNTDPSAARLAVRGVRLSETALQAFANQELVAEWAMSATPAAGDFRVKLRLPAGDETHNAIADLVVQPMRVVATAPIARGSLVVASMVRVEPTPLEELRRTSTVAFNHIDKAIGREARRPIRAGEVVGDANTQAPLMVGRGEQVDVVVGGGGVLIKAIGVAKQEGRHGELIPVTLADSGKPLMARVVGPRRLAILSGGAASPLTLTGGLR